MNEEVERVQTGNWRSAQSIPLSVPFVPAALQLLRFLSQVDLHRCLYQGPAIARAIQRYEECWLPLLAECKNGLTPAGFPLQPPLDCAWIWHCHRLNPIVYARNCKLLYGRVLGAPPTVDTREAIESSRSLWENQFPQQFYHLDLTQFSYDDQWQPSAVIKETSKIQYNLEEAVIRQNTFYYQVSQPHMKEESFLRASEQRYKGFLHLFKLTECKVFLVPTYDIDLMWHAHQLNPEAYSQDLTHILGRVLEHDDTDSNRSPGEKLHEGFQQTCQLWHQSYGSTYQRAGAMYRGEPPAPIELPLANAKPITVVGMPSDFTPIAPREVMQVALTIIRARNVPKKGGTLRVRLRMERKCSSFKLDTNSIPVLPEVGWNHTWTFQVEKSTDSLKLELLRKRSNTIKQKIVGSEVLGQACLSWQTVLGTPTLSYDGWLTLSSTSSSIRRGSADGKPPSLLVSVSVTPPQPAPQLFRAINCIPTDDLRQMDVKDGKLGCWLTKTVLDHANRVVFIVRARCTGSTLTSETEKCIHIHQGDWEYPDSYSDVGIAPAKTVATARHVVAERDTLATLSMQRCWSFFDNSSQLVVSRAMSDSKWNIRPLLELRGSLQNQIGLVCGRKLDYEVKGASEEEEGGFVTLVRYSLDAPLGRATALFNWRTGAMEVSPEESIVLVLLLLNIISMSVFNMEGLSIKFNKSRPPKRQTISSDEWGSVVLTTRDGRSYSTSKSMMPYYCWWDMSPILWAANFYSPGNVLVGSSGCGAAGTCGAGACGGSACGGAGCGGGGCGGGCGGG